MGYGLEALKRLSAGRSIIYGEAGIIVEELPDGRRFEVDMDDQYREKRIRELESVEPITRNHR